ncbi:PEP-CTERM sorting domain-containing protein [Roseateles sp. DB2]|uniref:PEP-CTERM sorting domain-containing protein n=1 Tax=Roseateles sp. DB2 TaxID=3453717 RepID=UPI003EEF1F3B
MNMKFRARLLAAIAITCAASTPAVAAPVLDQAQQESGGSMGLYDTFSRSQVFTAGLSGQLTGIDVNFIWAPEDGSLLFSLYKAPFGTPEETALFTLKLDHSVLSAGWQALDLTDQGFFVDAGTQYAFGLQNTGSRESWTLAAALSTLDPYAGGRTFHRDSADPLSDRWTVQSAPAYYGEWDLQFHTWVDTAAARNGVPEPASLALALGAVAALGATRRRAPASPEPLGKAR